MMSHFDRTLETQRCFGFDADVTNVLADGTSVIIERTDLEPIRFQTPDAETAQLFPAMFEAPVSEHQVQSLTQAAIAFAMLNRLATACLINWHLYVGTRQVLSLVPRAWDYRLRADPQPEGPMHLSRFALLRREGAQMLLESADIGARLVVHDMHAALRAVLSGEVAPEHPCAEFLWQAGFLVELGAEETDAQKCWEFHDRLFFAESRIVHDRDLPGQTFRLMGEVDCPPAIKPQMAGQVVKMPASVAQQPPSPVQTMLDARRSSREPASRPIRFTELCHLLHRSARTDGVIPTTNYDALKRPYPSGGGIFEHECYVAVRRCEGLEPGLYHYQSEAHQLVALPDTAEFAAEQAEFSARVMMAEAAPDLVITVTSRVPRITWKYNKFGLRLSLLNAGALLQNFYLNATELGLACCANGLGLSKDFQQASQEDSWVEVPIVELAVSALPAPKASGAIPPQSE